MGQIEELQGRIATALDRISQGLDLQANTQVDADEVETLQQALEDERITAQQLEERNKALNDKIAALEADLADAQAQASQAADAGFPDVLEQFGATVAEVRQISQATRDENQTLRDAVAAGTSETDLINSSMTTELSSLRADRALDRAELQAILETLEAALGGSQPAEGGL
ncbi:MAG: hypothetical protein AAGB07_00865 [Pseudomonadota bacterium]